MAEGADPEDPDAWWTVKFEMPRITPPPPEPTPEELAAAAEEEAAGKKKKKKAPAKAKPKVRPVQFELSFDGTHWFGTPEGIDVHIQVKEHQPPQ